MRAKDLRKMFDRMKSVYETEVRSRHLQVRDYMMPELGHFDGETREELDKIRARNIIMSTAENANAALAASFAFFMTSPSQRWMSWRPADKGMLEMPGVREWYEFVETKLFQTLANSNFYPMMHAAYTEFGPFGMFDLLMEEDDKDFIRFTHLPVGSYYWATNARGEVDTVVWSVTWTARQIAEKYGIENMSPGAIAKLKKNPDEKIECYHFVMPRENYNPLGHFRTDMPFANYVIERATEDYEGTQMLHVGGYREFPHLTARWFQYGQDVYSKECPGFKSIPDVRQLHETARVLTKMAHLSADPAMRVPSGFNHRLKMIPGGQTQVDAMSNDAVSPLYTVNPAALGPLREWLQSVIIPSIETNFMKNILMMFTDDDRSGITATEIMEKRQEKMLMAGSPVDRVQRGTLDPMIERLFRVLFRRGEIPEIPQSLGETYTEIEYTSILAQAQKTTTRQSIQAMIEYVLQVSASAQRPDLLDKLDLDQSIDEVHRVLGAPASIIKPDAAVQQIRQARMEAAAEAQAAQSAQLAAQIGKTAGDVSMDPSTLSGRAAELVGVG